MDYFALLGLPINYQVDTDLLTQHYQQLQRQYHPDRYVQATESEQLKALQQATTINEAYQTLKHPLRRAEYILSLQGLNINKEQQTVRDTQFLMSQLTLREELESIACKISESPEQAERELLIFSQQTAKMSAQYYHELQQYLESQHWDNASEIVNKLKFIDKLQQRQQQVEEQLFDF